MEVKGSVMYYMKIVIFVIVELKSKKLSIG